MRSPASRSAGLALVLLCAAACGKDGPAAPPPKPAARAYRVTATKVESRPLVYAVEAIGSLDPLQVVTVPARVEGALDRLDFDVGSVVTPETVLAVVDERRYSLVVAQAKAAVEEAEASARATEAAMASAAARTARVTAELDEARSNLARWTALRAKDPGFVSEEKILGVESGAKSLAASLDEAKAGEAEAAARLRQAKATVESRQATVAIAAKNVEDTRIRSPIAGVVETRHVAAGQYVKVGEAVATLVDVSKLRLRFSVSESESVRLVTGQSVGFRVKAFAGREFRAQLFHVDATADAATRMVDCLATVTDGDPSLRPGFFAQVDAEIARKDAALVVPEGALLATEKGFVAYVVEDGRAVARPLALGMHTKDAHVEVLAGLAAGERLVVGGAQNLTNGVVVEVVEDGVKQ